MKEFVKAIFAGLMIGIAGTIYLKVEPQWVGALLFSIGLILICLNNFNLFTGKIGYIKGYKEIPQMLLYILGNFIGVGLIAMIVPVSATEMVAAKLAMPLSQTFVMACGCGLLMYLAVDGYKKYNNIISIITCVSAFILVGFEHSIADMFYIFTTGTVSLQSLVFIIVVLLGNTCGALLHNLIREDDK